MSRSIKPVVIRSQSSVRWNYLPDERPAHRSRVRTPNAFVEARMSYRHAA
jgi:hypothetical protein